MTQHVDRRSFLFTTAAGATASVITAAPGIARAAPTTVAAGSIATLIQAERETIQSAMAKHAIEGVSVCLVHAGTPVWVEGFGTTDSGGGTPVGQDTIFSIQSTSKNFTAVGVLLAVQAGLLDLDVPITRYLSGFSVRSRFEDRPQDRITLRLLLSHRAGFTHEAPVGNNYEAASPSFAAHVQSISETWLRYPVGDRYRYSNLGYDLAAFVLEQKTGMSYGEWLRRRLFEPLGMRDSTADPRVYAARRNRAIGHDAGHSTVPLTTPLVGSGGVYTSGRDMAAYSAFHLDEGRHLGSSLLAPELWAEMHGFGLGGDYGLGVIRNEVRYGDTTLRILSHKGGGFGFGCVFIFCPEAGVAWTAMFNRPVSSPYRFGSKLIEGILSDRYGPAAARTPVSTISAIRPTNQLKELLAGSYVGRNVNARISVKNDTLMFDQDETDTHGPLLISSPADFFTAAANNDLTAYRYHAATPDLPAHLECSEGEASLDFNDGPHVPVGPDRATWTPYEGRYTVDQWGVASLPVTIERRRGYLFLNGIRLVLEHELGLFFTSDGEAVDFRSSPPTWRSLRLRRL